MLPEAEVLAEAEVLDEAQMLAEAGNINGYGVSLLSGLLQGLLCPEESQSTLTEMSASQICFSQHWNQRTQPFLRTISVRIYWSQPQWGEHTRE